jgi:hypothetical protein
MPQAFVPDDIRVLRFEVLKWTSKRANCAEMAKSSAFRRSLSSCWGCC